MNRAEKVLTGLASLRAEGTLCDVELKTEDQTIPAHKAVLAAATPYFAAMFSGKFKETKSRIVTVKDVTFVGLKNVIECIYTTKSNINAKNIEDILPAAHLLQMADIVDECKEWMSGKITKTNCFSFLRLAERYNIETVEKAITDFVLRNFVAVSETKGFAEISQQALCRYISSDMLKTQLAEISVFKAAKKWIVKNKITDDTIVYEVMKNVRFALIPPITLSTQVSTDDLIDNNRDCRKMVGKAMTYHADVYNQPFYNENINRPRGTVGMLVVANGTREENSFTASSNENIDFLPIPALTPAKQSKSLALPIVFDSMSAIQINNFLFLFGSKSDGYQNFTMRYDASNDTWMTLDAVPREATVGSTTACAESKKEVFLIGGMYVNSTTKFTTLSTKITSTVYTYNIQNNAWTQCKDLPEQLAHSASTTLGSFVYVTGGYSSTKTTSECLFAYDLRAKGWLTKAKMNHKRCQHILEVVDEKLYAMAGRVFEEDSRTVASIEIYDRVSNQWTIALIDGVSIIAPSSVAHGTIIYIIGGLVDAGYRSKQVCVYDACRNKVTHLSKKLLPHAGVNISACLTLPKLL